VSTKEKARQRMRCNYRSLTFWRRAERLIAKRLRQEGIPCRLLAARKLPWDIEAGSLHIECKAARLLRERQGGGRRKNGTRKSRSPFWMVTIKRHGRLDERGVNFYVLYLTGCDDLRPVYVVLKAPLRQKHISITLRQLLMKWSSKVNAWHLIRESGRTR
jgi:hypothetical protein